MVNEVIEVNTSEEVKRKVVHRIMLSHVKGLDEQKAMELGVFDRISVMLCAMHMLNCVSVKVYADVEYMLKILGADSKREIRIACNQFQTAFDNFMRFWSNHYARSGNPVKEMNMQVEALYHQFMSWAQIPESWSLGDPQSTMKSEDYAILVTLDDIDIKFFNSVLDRELVEDPEETYIVTKYDRSTKKQITIENNMDKASAMMIAKRLSAEDKENLYIACLERTLTERRKELIPFKVYSANNIVGTVKKKVKD